MKNIFFLIALFLCVCSSCKKALDVTPQGVVSNEELNTPENAEKLIIAAYSALGNDDGLLAYYSSMGPYGNTRSGDAYKGGDGPGDGADRNAIETFVLNRPDLGSLDYEWSRLYVAVARVNDALGRVNSLTPENYPQMVTRQGELRFLRAHFYFLLKILFKHVPYIDETIPKSEYATISNRNFSDEELWTKIAEDFRFAVANLPETQTEPGRATKFAAKAYLAKALLYQAYKQDDNNNVVSIDQAKLEEVNGLCDEVISSGKYGLHPDFAYNFLSQYENGIESVFAIQYSVNDGTPMGREDFSHELNYPMNQEYGCCGFSVPTNNLINAFQTSAAGLPLFDTYNNNDIVPNNDFQTRLFDPRMDHTAAIPGHPYKYRPGFIYDVSWARAPQIYGPLLSMKETVLPDDPTFKKYPPFMSSGKNWAIIRFADVLLFKAEALIELNRPQEALPLINQIRTRAANSTNLLKQLNGAATSNYKIDTYKPGVNCVWSQQYATEALRYERRMEFALEGYRFFDLVRWGIAADYINKYLTVEKTRRPHLRDATFTKGRDEYLPIPTNQINFSKGLYVQNSGW